MSERVNEALIAPDGPSECSPDGWCSSMLWYLEHASGNPWTIGVSSLFNTETGADQGVTLRIYTPKRKPYGGGVVLVKHCPFCGVATRVTGAPGGSGGSEA